MANLGADPCFPGQGEEGTRARVCIASYEVVGPTRNGGIGTAYTSLAHALGRAGHDVTLLYTGEASGFDDAARERWIAEYAEHGVALAFLDEGGDPDGVPRSPYTPVRRGWALARRLLREDAQAPYDVVHYPETAGHGWFTALAKRQGLGLRRAVLVCGLHASSRWCAEANVRALVTEEELVEDFLERRSAELADVAISPSAYLLGAYARRGWRLPDRSYVQQYVRADNAQAGAAREAAPPREIVFFGRLETRKGMEAFCDAIDLLAQDPPRADLEITFMGSATEVLGVPSRDYVARRAAGWPWPHQILADYDQPAAVAYLRERDCIAVMPSLVDNSPNTVLEAIGLGLSFVTSAAGGTAELIHPDDRERTTFDGWHGEAGVQPPLLREVAAAFDARPLAELLRHRVASEAPPARPALAAADVEHSNVAWHAGVAARRAHAEAPAPAAPAVGVLLAGPEEAEPPAGAAGSAFVAEDGIHRSGEARNEGLARCGGELVLVLDTRLRPREGLVERLAAAASGSDADAFALCVAGGGEVAVPTGGPAAAGLTHQPFSAGAYAIRRAAIERLGGFAPDARGAEADHELLSRALLAGVGIETLSEPLLDDPSPEPERGRRFSFRPDYRADQLVRALRAYRSALGDDLGDVASVLWREAGLAREAHLRVCELDALRDDQQDYIEQQRALIEKGERNDEELRAYIRELEGRVTEQAQELRAIKARRSWKVANALADASAVVRRGNRRGEDG